ncbi:hypothetical protein [Allorhizocola rhizosphaerae]|uniref:hypothetical protein n=1 Tax=Allorhizocola rhizosphaerae TaxID=1872709 RepID=UPI0013C2A79A|nr:hypothetical protein [Allorhizocola rhizosphaerae]
MASSTSRSNPLRVLGRWWPALLGVLIGVAGLLTVEPWRPSEPTTAILPMLAVAYLVFGAARKQLRRPGVLRLELLGLVIFGGCTLLAVLVDPKAGHYIAAAGWIAHAAWDVTHHRDLSRHYAVGVVPRGYAEFCIAVDLLVGAALIVAPVA